MLTSLSGKLDVVNALLNSPGILVDQADARGMTALAAASMKGHAAIVERLLGAGANSALLDISGQGCLHYAIANGHVRVAKAGPTSQAP
jgi:ankyrin repeat protein